MFFYSTILPPAMKQMLFFAILNFCLYFDFFRPDLSRSKWLVLIFFRIVSSSHNKCWLMNIRDQNITNQVDGKSRHCARGNACRAMTEKPCSGWVAFLLVSHLIFSLPKYIIYLIVPPRKAYGMQQMKLCTFVHHFHSHKHIYMQ